MIECTMAIDRGRPCTAYPVIHDIPRMFEEFVQGSAWHTAQSGDHQYCIYNEHCPQFILANFIIEFYGHDRKWRGSIWRYYTHGNWEYWGYSDDITKRTLINRARVDRVEE